MLHPLGMVDTADKVTRFSGVTAGETISSYRRERRNDSGEPRAQP
jgi:hypothetical protein